MARIVSFPFYLLLFITMLSRASQSEIATGSTEIVERSFSSEKIYVDPFNDVDVDVDVIFFGQWQNLASADVLARKQARGVRFAPPSAGKYSYRLESTDRSNADLNRHMGSVTIAAYRGGNALLTRSFSSRPAH